MPTTMTVSGSHMDAVSPAAVWTVPGCKVDQVAGSPVSATAYQLVLTPAASAAVGDTCSLRLQQPGVDQTLAAAFVTGM